MAVHTLDDGATVYSYGMDAEGNPEQTPITDADERYAFFEYVSFEQLRLLREERNTKLAETDWIITKHSETGTSVPTEWATYRQALRDITDTYVNQFDVVWPVKP